LYFAEFPGVENKMYLFIVYIHIYIYTYIYTYIHIYIYIYVVRESKILYIKIVNFIQVSIDL